MSKLEENRVLSAKTSRGSQYPSSDAGQEAILQPAQDQVQDNTDILEDAKRVIEVGKILRSVLTLEELRELHKGLYGSGISTRSH